jgi:hypothetical protein
MRKKSLLLSKFKKAWLMAVLWGIGPTPALDSRQIIGDQFIDNLHNPLSRFAPCRECGELANRGHGVSNRHRTSASLEKRVIILGIANS